MKKQVKDRPLKYTRASQCIFFRSEELHLHFLTHTYRQNQCNFQINRHFKFFVTGEYHNLLSYMLQHRFLTIEQCSNHWHAVRDYQSYPEINLEVDIKFMTRFFSTWLKKNLVAAFLTGTGIFSGRSYSVSELKSKSWNSKQQKCWNFAKAIDPLSNICWVLVSTSMESLIY